MTRHGHIHKTIGRGIDSARVTVLAAIGIVGGYSINEFQLLVIGDYSHFTRLVIFIVLLLSLYLLLTPLVGILHAAQSWFDDLEVHAHDQPDNVGIGTRLLLWSFRSPSIHEPLPQDDDADDDEEKAMRAFAQAQSDAVAMAETNGKLHVSAKLVEHKLPAPTPTPTPTPKPPPPPPPPPTRGPYRSATGAIVRPLAGYP